MRRLACPSRDGFNVPVHDGLEYRPSRRRRADAGKHAGGVRHAFALGCDGAELDVQLSADGVVVVHHDFRLNPAMSAQRWQLAEGRDARGSRI